MLEAMSGRPDDGRNSVREAQRLGEELGLKVRSGMSADYAGLVELVAGDLDAAEQELRAGYELLGSIGEDAFRRVLARSLSEVLYMQSRYEEALELLDFEDATIGARRGKILARLGDLAEGERLARVAVESWKTSDYLVERADALMDLAEVLRLATRPAESVGFVSEGLRLYEEKGNIAFAAKARAVLGELSAKPS
jgi:tetratricopeptide (TPR) repeat protein